MISSPPAWYYLHLHDIISTCMIPSPPAWYHLSMYDIISTCMITFPPAWYHLHLHDIIFTCMISSPPVWYHLHLHDIIFTCMISSPPAWYHLHLHDTIYTCMISYTAAWYYLHLHDTISTWMISYRVAWYYLQLYDIISAFNHIIMFAMQQQSSDVFVLLTNKHCFNKYHHNYQRLSKWSKLIVNRNILNAGVTVSDYPPVQVTPGGNLNLPPLVSNYHPQFYQLTFNNSNKLYFIFSSHGIGTFFVTLLMP